MLPFLAGTGTKSGGRGRSPRRLGFPAVHAVRLRKPATSFGRCGPFAFGRVPVETCCDMLQEGVRVRPWCGDGIEAVTVSLTGGVMGIALGVLGSWTIAYFAGWLAPIQARAVIPAFLFAGAVGVFFGFYPARKASRLNPIDALRYE